MADTSGPAEAALLARRLTEEGQRVVDFFGSLSDGDWDRPVYTGPLTWRVRDILAHFVSAESAYVRFVKDALAGGRGLPEGFDIDAFNATEVPTIADRPPMDLIQEFQITRGETVRLAASMAASDLDRDGFHPWFGTRKLAWYLRLCYNHNSRHLRDVRRAVLGRGAVKPARVSPDSPS